jgi:hypothetical protein
MDPFTHGPEPGNIHALYVNDAFVKGEVKVIAFHADIKQFLHLINTFFRASA